MSIDWQILVIYLALSCLGIVLAVGISAWHRSTKSLVRQTKETSCDAAQNDTQLPVPVVGIEWTWYKGVIPLPRHPVLSAFRDPMNSLTRFTAQHGPVFRLKSYIPWAAREWYIATAEKYASQFYTTSNKTLDFVDAFKELVPGVVGGEQFVRVQYDQQKALFRSACWSRTPLLDKVYLPWMKDIIPHIFDRYAGKTVDLFELGSAVLLMMTMRLFFGRAFYEKNHRLCKQLRDSQMRALHPWSVLTGNTDLTMLGRRKASKLVADEVRQRIQRFNEHRKKEQQDEHDETGESANGDGLLRCPFLGEGRGQEGELDYLDHLILKYYSKSKQECRLSLQDTPVEDITRHLLNFLMTSQTSSGHTLGWAFYMTLTHPEVIESLARPCDTEEDAQQRENLVNAILDESVRLWGNLFTIRVVKQDPGYQLGPYFIPKDAFLFFTPCWSAYNSPERDPACLEWDPLTVSKLSPKERLARFGPALNPFGASQHRCLGEPFIRMEVKTIFDHLFPPKTVAEEGQPRRHSMTLLDTCSTTDPMKLCWSKSISNPLPFETIRVAVTRC